MCTRETTIEQRQPVSGSKVGVAQHFHCPVTGVPLALLEAGQISSTQTVCRAPWKLPDDKGCDGTKEGEPGGCSIQIRCL